MKGVRGREEGLPFPRCALMSPCSSAFQTLSSYLEDLSYLREGAEEKNSMVLKSITCIKLYTRTYMGSSTDR